MRTLAMLYGCLCGLHETYFADFCYIRKSVRLEACVIFN